MTQLCICMTSSSYSSGAFLPAAFLYLLASKTPADLWMASRSARRSRLLEAVEAAADEAAAAVPARR